MKKEVADQKAVEAVQLGDSILMSLDRENVDPNTAQAALGYAWVGLLKGMGWNKKHFLQLTKDVANITWREDGVDRL